MASSREDTDDTESFDDSFSDDDDNHEPLNQGKHKEAFSTLVECLYKWHTFISRIFLKIGWITVSAE